MAVPAVAADSHRTSCTDQVRVRSKPAATAPIVGSCSAGEKVTAAESRDGFTRLSDKKGWVSSQYIKDADSSDSNNSRYNDDDNNSRYNDNNSRYNNDSDDRDGDRDSDYRDNDDDHYYRHRDYDDNNGLLGGGGGL
ncbi:MAG TPA: SH3 domain-containing protein [Pseudonocardia sp.]